MIGLAALAIVGPAAALAMGLGRLGRSRRRTRLLGSAIDEGWKDIIQKNVALYAHIPDDLKHDLHGCTQILIAEKNFEGAGGLRLTLEMKVTISALASILLINRKTRFYPVVDSIIVYPGAYIAERHSEIGFGITEEDVLLGESSIHGAVVLAWDHVIGEARDLTIGRNVVLHEFAHQLDEEDGQSDGTPILKGWSSYAEWGRVLGCEYKNLQDKVAHHQRDVLDSYGATDAAEFFAVATETFYCKPLQLKEKHPALYDELKKYYEVDPAEWFVSTRSR
jgi:Mlc titration factor MtfA (ptsG expression regulator)